MEKYKELFNNKNIDEYVDLINKILYERSTFVENSTNDELRNRFYEFLKTKIKEIYTDNIEYIGSGHSTLAFKINDLVLKISKTNHKLDKTYNYDCLIPVLYKESFKIDEKEYYNIEITPYFLVNEIDIETLYSTYERLRKNGYIWNDPKSENVGMITKDIEVNGIKYKKGDNVIIDLEDLAYVGEITPEVVMDEIAFNSYNSYVYKFETRYMENLKTK